MSFRREDAVAADYAPATYDAVVTAFFMDCFARETLALLLPRLVASLRPGGLWLQTDFALPSGGWRLWRARLWVGGLYAFFRATTDIEASELPPSEALLEQAGLRAVDSRTWQAGLLRSVLYSGLGVVPQALLGAQKIMK